MVQLITPKTVTLLGEQPRRRGPWGQWRYRASNRTLEFGSHYWIDLDRCTDSAHILDWIAQLAHKTWVTPEDLGHLVRALDDLLWLQANICGSGVDHRINPRNVLAA